MKTTNLILSILFFAVLGTVLSLAINIEPSFGLLLSGAAFLPMPTGVLGENIIPKTDPPNEQETKFLEKVQEKIKKALTEFNRGFIDEAGLKAKLEPIEKAVKEMKDEGISKKLEEFKTNFEKSFNDLAATVEKISEQGKSNGKDGFGVALKSAWEGLKEKFEKDPDLRDATITIKALPLTTATWTGSTNYPFLQDDQEEGIVNEPRSPQTFNADVPTGRPINPNSDTWTWIERSTIVDNTGMVAEGGTFGTVEVAYLKNETKVRKIGDYTKVTREMLEDWDEFLEAVEALIETLNNEKLNDQLFNGDGTGINLSGIKINSVEFDANGMETTTPNIFDSIKAAITQILVNGLTGWIPNKIYMHPVDVTTQELSKDSTGNYVFPPFIMPNGMTVGGIPITQTTDISQGFFEVCDITKARKRFKRELELRLWEQNEDDVIKDLLTMTGSLRVAFRIKDLEKPAFVYDSFDASIAILTDTAAALAMIIAATTGMAQDGLGDASKLTINLLTKAGVTTLTASKLPDYKTDVAAAASIANLAALQAIIDAA